MVKKKFKVTLAESAPYEFIELKERFDCSSPSFSNYTIVWVDVAKLVELSEIDPFSSFLPHVNQWSKEKKELYINLMKPDPELDCLGTPFVSFTTHETTTKRFGFFKQRTVTRSVGFIDGRHRARICEYLGAKRIPVITHVSHKADFEQYCT
ncbi:hypothetical protein [Vibrio gangliei]|uniref:hypothetical protein n=1 Tax=Vibrio gangliei TaxID=2077090 RepID=UPI000D0177B1|nr:hypothetical protein [Vibrio gangliei]